jgi:hypothetical protein
MSDAPKLTRFTITEVEDGYRLRIESDGGAPVELSADEADLDLIIDELDAVLGEFSDGET